VLVAVVLVAVVLVAVVLLVVGCGGLLIVVSA
jgi:hypothetical protein